MMNSIIIAVVAALIIVLLLVVLLLFAKAKLTTSGEVTIDINDGERGAHGFDRRIASCDACCPEYLSAVRLRRTGYLRNVQVPGIGGRR